MAKKHAILAHGDCDGVISAFLYVKHFMPDAYPSHISLGFTQPWRATAEVNSFRIDEFSSLVLLDVAVDKELFSHLVNYVMSGVSVSVIDHHYTSSAWIEKLKRLGVRIIWDIAPSTPSLMVSKLSITLNPYEEILVKVADVCEGSECNDDYITQLSDKVKLSISIDPGDIEFMKEIVDVLMQGGSLESFKKLEIKYKKAKWLLNKLVDIASERAIDMGSTLISRFKEAETRIFAGLFGIAATEITRKFNKDSILVRKEEGKIVVTIRSPRGLALNYCKAITSRFGGKYGGHREAASATLPEVNLDEVIKSLTTIVDQVSKSEATRDMSRRNI